MVNKKSKGRQKIPMKKIENREARFATFSKRREGLYKKASELAIECDVDIGIIMLSPTGKPHSFFHPNVDAIVSPFQNPDMQISQSDRLVAACARNRVNQLKSSIEELDIRKDIAIARANDLDQKEKTRQRGWWESIEQLNADELTNFEAWLNATSFNMHQHLNQLENGASTLLGRESFGV
ncbi:putative transcription factor-like [Capsicum annuum]|nr:putative transcription factor-like [Capsicum annuum]